MKMTDIVRRSGRNLRTAKVRTLLTALAIAVGGFTLTLTLAAGNGIRHYTDALVTNNFDPAELIVGRDKEITSTGAPSSEPKEFDESISSVAVGGGGQGSIQLKQVTQDDVDALRKLPYVERVRESYQLSIRYVTRDDQKRYTLSGEVYNPAQRPELVTGKLPAGNDLPAGSIFLPDAYIASLGFGSADQAIGKKVEISVQRPFGAGNTQALLQQFQSGASAQELAANQALKPEAKTMTFTVAGVTKRPATSIAVGALPALFSTADAKDIYTYTTEGTSSYQKYTIVFVRVKDGGDAAKLQSAKSDLESKQYFVQSSKDIQKAITQIVNILQILVGVFGIITLIASVFGIVNTQYISVLERTREIGLMKALGMPRKGVGRLFIVEATWIGFLGGALGVLAGLALGVAVNPAITKQLELGEGNSLLMFNFLQLALLILGLMLIATVAGSLPSRKAAKLDPIEALRTE
jgi:putative ABC transport system permease protein